jgi:hypothetical protein
VNDSPEFERYVGLGILGVVAIMSWPVWGEIIAAKHEFTWTVAASGLFPLGLTLMVLGLALRVPERVGRHYHHGLHELGDRLHGGSHRHA